MHADYQVCQESANECCIRENTSIVCGVVLRLVTSYTQAFPWRYKQLQYKMSQSICQLN
jgi:hypothetical protein